MDKNSAIDATPEVDAHSVPSWVKRLPTLLRNRIEHRHNLQKILGNSSWLFADRILRLGIGLLIGVWIARYLGPVQFGLLNYAMALIALFSSIAGLGMNGIVVRDLVRQPKNANVIIGTAFLLQLAGGVLAFGFAVIVVNYLRPDDSLVKFIVLVLGLTLIFKASEVVKYWFESQVKSKYVVLLENGVFIVFAMVKIWLILAEASILTFVWTTLAEAVFVSIFLLVLYSKVVGPLTLWHTSISRAKKLLMESWPLVLGATASMINMRMDQVILGTLSSNDIVGNYAAAVRIAEVWLVIPGIVGASIYPALILAREKNVDAYRNKIRQITKLMAVSILPLALLISLLADQIISLIYGVKYELAGSILAIYIWTGVPYLVFFVLSQVFYIEGLLKTSLFVSIFAVMANILLNFLLIPMFWGIGAAVASLITSTSSILLSILILNFKTGIFWGERR